MNEETLPEKKTDELTDSELDNVAGGTDPYQNVPPGYEKKPIIKKNP